MHIWNNFGRCRRILLPKGSAKGEQVGGPCYHVQHVERALQKVQHVTMHNKLEDLGTMGSLDNWTMCVGCLLACLCSLAPRIWDMRLCKVMVDPTNKNYITTCLECCARWTRPVSTLHLSIVPEGPHWRVLESLLCNVFGSFFCLQNT